MMFTYLHCEYLNTALSIYLISNRPVPEMSEIILRIEMER